MSGAEVQAGAGFGATRLEREDPAVRRAATRYVASAVRDAADCALLLEALGLTAEEGR